MSPPPRARRKRREQERAVRKAVRRTESLAGQLPGGSPEQPIDVPAASVVEVKARAIPCIHCSGDLELRRDRASSTARGILREVELVCRQCHAPRTVWFLIAPVGTN